MAKIAFKPPVLGANVTVGFLSDELGKVKAIISAAKKLEEFYKIALIARLDAGQTEVSGDSFITTISKGERTALDQAKAKELLGDRLAEAMVTTEQETVRNDIKIGAVVKNNDIHEMLEYLFPKESKK